jgi:hypothetical protein
MTKVVYDSADIRPLVHEDCGIAIDENRIKNNLNLDYFLTRIQKDSYSLCTKKQRIPPYIYRKVDCLLGDMANPGERWTGSCSISEDLPFKQLVYFAVNKQKDVLVIVYRSRTIGVSTTILFLQLGNKGISVDGQK